MSEKMSEEKEPENAGGSFLQTAARAVEAG